MKKEIGIGIIDLYTEEDLQNCWDSIPTEYKNHDDLLTRVYIVSNNKNKYISEGQQKKYTTAVQMATMRNHLISQMRLRGCKHYFIICSNQVIKDQSVFENTIKIAETFGTNFITGPEISNLTIEDDENNQTLTLSNKLNTNFIYINSDVISKLGYFDERYFNTKDLDVLDYIYKLREKEMYPPKGYNPVIVGDITSSNSKIQKENHKELPNQDKDIQMSYAYFMHVHKIIPLNDEEAVSKDDLMASLEKIQTNYAKK